MSFPRCKNCKSPVNPTRFRRCIGCGVELDETLPPDPRQRNQVLAQGTRDAGSAAKILSVIGALGIIGFFPSTDAKNGYLMVLSGVAAVTGIVVWIVQIGKGGKGRSGPGCLGALLIAFLCVAALFFGLGILLGFACIDNGGRF